MTALLGIGPTGVFGNPVAVSYHMMVCTLKVKGNTKCIGAPWEQCLNACIYYRGIKFEWELLLYLQITYNFMCSIGLLGPPYVSLIELFLAANDQFWPPYVRFIVIDI